MDGGAWEQSPPGDHKVDLKIKRIRRHNEPPIANGCYDYGELQVMQQWNGRHIVTPADH